MKLPSLIAASLALVISSPAVFAAQSTTAASSRKWVSDYYQNPQPAALADAVYQLSRTGYFDGPGQPATAIGFFSTVFAQNPDKVDGWLNDFRNLPEKEQRILASAVWYAGLPQGKQLLNALSAHSSREVRSGVTHMLAKGNRPVVETPVLSESSMNLQWGAFLASGNEKHITNILAAVGSGQPGITDAARLSLAMNAASHSRVMEICRAQLDKQPNEVRSVLRAALNEAETKRHPDSI